MITLFLDFDGVLHPDSVYREPGRGIHLRGGGGLFMHAPALEEALEPFPAVQIVLSTTWVSVLGFASAKKRLSTALQDRVVGATYHRRHTVTWESQTRYQQIIAHVIRRGLGARWVAVDDETEGWPPDRRQHLVSPQSAVGLQPADIQLLTQRLQQLHK